MKVFNVLIVGVGGQGTLLTSRIIGKTALNNGLDVKMSEVHGMAQRGGSVVTFVRFGDDVKEPVVEIGEADVIISFEQLEALRYAHYLKKDGVIIVNDYRIKPMSVLTGASEYPNDVLEVLNKDHKVYTIDALKVAKNLNNPKVVNTVVLGFASKHFEFDKQCWLDVIKETVPQKTIDLNIQAFNAGYDLSK
jgi:indolepyruvate ferredoxin oxidoreductase beta subunit